MNQEEIDAINLRAARRARTTYADGVQDFAARADKAFSECGLERPRRPRAGEPGMNYRADVLEEFMAQTAKPENSEWFPSYLDSFDPKKAFVEGSTTSQGANALAENIFDAVAKGFQSPVGPERSCTRRDQTGREIIQPYGAHDAVWTQFTNGPKRGRIRTPHCQNDLPTATWAPAAGSDDAAAGAGG